MTATGSGALRFPIAKAIRRSLWAWWGEYVPPGDEMLSSLGDTAVEGYCDAADDVLAAIAEAGLVLSPAGGALTAAIDAVCSWVEGDLDMARDGWMDGGPYSNDAEMRAHIATLKAIVERGADG